VVLAHGGRDLVSVASLCDRIAILHAGQIVECGNPEAVFQQPQHPYAKQLIAALPKLPFPPTEDGMKRERTLQVVLVVLGLFYSFWGYLLFYSLWHSRWLTEHNDVLPMFLSLNTLLGVFLLLAVKQPAKHRSVIAYGAWSSLAHGFTMTIQSAEAVAHGTHRNDSPWDIVIFGVIGVALLALLPAKQPSPAPVREPRFAEG
jgi:hypothetical protein